MPTETKPVVGEKNANIEGEEDMEDLEDDPVRQTLCIHKLSLVKSVLTL